MVKRIVQHGTVGFISLLLFLIFSSVHPPGTQGIWRSLGDVAFVLLSVAIIIGPLSRLWRPALKLVSWRRSFGIWFFLVAATHYVFIQTWWFGGWWDFMIILGYNLQGGEYVLVDGGVGLANLLGLTGLVVGFLLAATSFDRAIRFLGPRQWKWLQNFSHVVFYLLAFHNVYYLFLHYADKGEKSWFGHLSLTLIFIVVLFQVLAFIKDVRTAKKGLKSFLSIP